MKLPEKPPAIDYITLNYKIRLKTGIEDIIQRANHKYIYWEQFKYWNMPEKISSEVVWSFVKLARIEQMKKITMKDKNGSSVYYCITNEIQRLLHYIDRDAPKKIVTDAEISSELQEQYIISSLMEEAIASSQIEGAATTRVLAKEMLRTGRKPKDESEQMILNNYNAMRRIKEFAKEPINIDILHILHSTLTENTSVKPSATGRLRRSDELVQVYDERDGTILFTPPPADQLGNRLEKLFKFANEDDPKGFIHPVIKGLILHFWLAYEHPYLDGNGRTARALFYWYMLKKEYWLFEFISISRILKRAPAQYARSFLYSEYDDNDLTYFLMYNIRTIEIALKELHLYLQRKQKEYLLTKDLLKNYSGINQRQYFILADAISKPQTEFTILGHMKQNRIVYQTARTDLLQLVEKELLDMIKRGKKYVFVSTDNLRQKLTASKNNMDEGRLL